jgi:hypothetical protein
MSPANKNGGIMQGIASIIYRIGKLFNPTSNGNEAQL